VDSTLRNVELLDWRTADEMLISASRGDKFAIYAMQLPSGQTRRLFDDLIVMQAELSPSRRYLACWCSTSRDSTQRITLLDLSGTRPLLNRGAPMNVPHRHIAWNAVEPTPYRDSSARRLALVARDSSTMADARTASDELRSLKTNPADTLALSRAKMRAAAAELARAGARLSFPTFTGLPERHPTDSLLFDEVWADIDTVRWRSFGAPRPRIGLATEGLDPGGDGSYPSGLYTRRAFTAPRGLVFDAIVSVPVTLPYWQGLTLTVMPEAVMNGMQKWNHVTGTWDQVRAARPFETGIQYPALESATRATSFTTISGGTSEQYAVSPAMGDGRDVALRVSLGPDSLMTVFINGQQYAQRRYTPTPNSRYHLMIMGHSAETRVRLRRLRVFVRR
jgi:hypothetical protein